MAQRGQATDIDERIGIGERAATGQTDAEIAADTGRSIWTVRKWRRKCQRGRRSSLASHVGRPATGALGRCPVEIRETIRQMREWNPG
jgi:transposase-like protein